MLDKSNATEDRCYSTKTGNNSFYITAPSGFRPKKKTKSRGHHQKSKSEWQSASTWRHSSPSYAFPKGERFIHSSLNYHDIVKIDIPEGRSSRACSFGSGRR